MARSIRFQAAGTYYHVTAHGNRREDIFHHDDERQVFFQALSDVCHQMGWRVHAWVLMDNHYHLFLQTPEPNLVAGMSWLQSALTRSYNVRNQKRGRTFGDRYKAVVVEGGNNYYYRTLMDYIHLNPVRAKIIQAKKGQSVLDYPWSSLSSAYAVAPKMREKWLAAEAGFKAFDLEDNVSGRRKMVERLDSRAVKEQGKNCGVALPSIEMDMRGCHLRRGWFYGTQAFGKKIRKLAAVLLKKAKRSKPVVAKKPSPVILPGESQAKEWLAEGLKAAGLKRADLVGMKGSETRKVLLADLLWRRTAVSQGWLAKTLAMKSAVNVSQQLRRLNRNAAMRKAPVALKVFLQQADESRSCDSSGRSASGIGLRGR